MPVLPRYHIDSPREELVFRALLHQPLILYGHHWDLAEGLDVLAEAAADVAELGEVSWGPPSWIAASNYSIRRAGDTLEVRLHTRRAVLEVPEGVGAIRVEVVGAYGDPLWSGVACGNERTLLSPVRGGWRSKPIEVSPASNIELSLPAACPLAADRLPDLRIRPWPAVRRVAVEGRDRLRPFLGRSPAPRARRVSA